MSAVHRIRVAIDVEVRAERPFTVGELLEVGRHVAMGDRLALRGRSAPIAESLDVEIRWPGCVDGTHRRNRIDLNAYQCGADEADAIHGSVEACSSGLGHPCEKPFEHHEYVSPGFEAPAGEAVAR